MNTVDNLIWCSHFDWPDSDLICIIKSLEWLWKHLVTALWQGSHTKHWESTSPVITVTLLHLQITVVPGYTKDRKQRLTHGMYSTGLLKFERTYEWFFSVTKANSSSGVTSETQRHTSVLIQLGENWHAVILSQSVHITEYSFLLCVTLCSNKDTIKRMQSENYAHVMVVCTADIVISLGSICTATKDIKTLVSNLTKRWKC